MRSICVICALVCGVFFQAGLMQAAEITQVADADHMAASEKIPGLHAGEHLLPLPTTMSHIDYEKILLSYFISVLIDIC